MAFVKPAASRVECGVRGCSSMVEQKLPKLTTRVRFPSPAPLHLLRSRDAHRVLAPSPTTRHPAQSSRRTECFAHRRRTREHQHDHYRSDRARPGFTNHTTRFPGTSARLPRVIPIPAGCWRSQCSCAPQHLPQAISPNGANRLGAQRRFDCAGRHQPCVLPGL